MKLKLPQRTTFAPSKSRTGVSTVAGSPAVGVEGRGTQQLGRVLSDIGNEILTRQQKARQQLALQRARDRAERRQAEFLRQFDPTNHERLTRELEEFQRDTLGEILEEVPREVRTEARGVVEGVFRDGLGKADQLRYEYGLDEIRGEHQQHRFDAMARAAATDDFEEVTAIEQEYYQTIDEMVGQGVYGQEKGQALKLSFSEGVVVDRLREMMIDEPHVVEEMLDDPERFPRLSGEQRRSLLTSATNAALAMDRREEVERRRREAEEERARQNAQDTRFMQLYRGTVDGSVTMEDVDMSRQAGLLRPTQYTQLLKVLASEDAQDNPQVVDSLRMGIMEGNVRNPQEVLNFVGEGLSTGTASDLINMIEQGAAVTQSRDFREARDYLDRQLGVTPGVQISVLKGDEQQTVARARRELYERVIAGEKSWEIVDEMLPRYQSRPRGLPDPMFESEADALDAFADGRISETVLDQQLRLLEMKGP